MKSPEKRAIEEQRGIDIFSTPVDYKDLNFAEVSTVGSDHHLLLEHTVSLSPLAESGAERAATVAKISSHQIWLELFCSSLARPFLPGEKVQVKYWNEQAAYYFDSEILNVSGPSNQLLTIAGPSEEISVQRRKAQRVSYPVSFSFTIIDAAESQLIGQRVLNAETENISVGGLAFRTTVPLRLRDKLEISFLLSPSEAVRAAGWVVRYEPMSSDGETENLVALEFLHLSGEEQNKLLVFLAQILPRESDSQILWVD